MPYALNVVTTVLVMAEPRHRRPDYDAARTKITVERRARRVAQLSSERSAFSGDPSQIEGSIVPLSGQRARANPRQPWPVAIFAHNEAVNIVACLESAAQASTAHPIHAYVLANGCHDRTEHLVRHFAQIHPWVSLVSLALGDKANAWNVFVHDVTSNAQVHFFVDGDVRVESGAFDALFSALQESPEANAAAALPANGRSKKYLEQLVCQHHLVLGNLYALRGDFVRQIKQLGVRLPIGYIGEDGLVTSLAKWNLDPTGPFLKQRVTPCPAARFVFRSFSPWHLRDWRAYWHRRVRYSLRHFQHELLVPLVTSAGLRGMPSTVTELYQEQSGRLWRCRARVGIDTIFDTIAINRMRKQR